MDLTIAFDNAAALALGWCVASIITGVCADDWLSLPADEHASSFLGVKGVLANWLIAAPLGQALKALALYGVLTGGWSAVGEATLPAVDLPALANTFALDVSGLLLSLTLWRRFLLGYLGSGY